MADIPRIEEDALRAAFESTMRETFGWQNFTRTTEHGYRVGFIQAAWFACRCGWLTGRSYGVEPSAGWVEAGLVCQACAGDAPGGKCKNPKCIGGPIVREMVPASGVPASSNDQGENHG